MVGYICISMSTTGRATFGGALTMNMTSIPGFSGSEVCNNDTLRQEAMFSNGDCGRCGNCYCTIHVCASTLKPHPYFVTINSNQNYL